MSGFDSSFIRVTSFGFIQYYENFVNEFQIKLKDIASAIQNEWLTTNREISEKLGEKLVFVDSLIEYWTNQGYLK